MREVKFRVYDTETNNYMYPNDLEHGDYSLGVLSGEVRGKYGEVFPNFVVEEFTGLKDKNGQKIYEGDSIKLTVTKDVYHKGKVIFKNGAFGINRFYLGAERFTSFTGYAAYCEIEILKDEETN